MRIETSRTSSARAAMYSLSEASSTSEPICSANCRTAGQLLPVANTRRIPACIALAAARLFSSDSSAPCARPVNIDRDERIGRMRAIEPARVHGRPPGNRCL